ncbi:MAG: hypothetical protein J1F36_06310 [Clostridiales bacterium]|nr:hypothetical protein [Clostridiales bacterium]
MGKFEICFIVAMSVLIALCLVSFIVTAAVGGRGAKITFCVISCLAFILMLGITLVWTGIIPDITGRLLVLKSNLHDVLLTVALGIVSACEFSGMLVMLVKKEHVSVIAHKEELSEVEAPQTEAVRKAGERKHGNYKIVGE